MEDFPDDKIGGGRRGEERGWKGAGKQGEAHHPSTQPWQLIKWLVNQGERERASSRGSRGKGEPEKDEVLGRKGDRTGILRVQV